MPAESSVQVVVKCPFRNVPKIAVKFPYSCRKVTVKVIVKLAAGTARTPSRKEFAGV